MILVSTFSAGYVAGFILSSAHLVPSLAGASFRVSW